MIHTIYTQLNTVMLNFCQFRLLSISSHAEVTHCGNYVVLSISKSCDPTNQLWYCDLRTVNMEIRPNLPFIKLINNFDGKFEVS